MLAISQWTGQIPRRPDLPEGCSVAQLIALGSRRKRSKVYWMLAQSEKEVGQVRVAKIALKAVNPLEHDLGCAKQSKLNQRYKSFWGNYLERVFVSVFCDSSPSFVISRTTVSWALSFMRWRKFSNRNGVNFLTEFPIISNLNKTFPSFPFPSLPEPISASGLMRQRKL